MAVKHEDTARFLGIAGQSSVVRCMKVPLLFCDNPSYYLGHLFYLFYFFVWLEFFNIVNKSKRSWIILFGTGDGCSSQTQQERVANLKNTGRNTTVALQSYKTCTQQ